MSKAIVGLDHVIIGVNDLEAARADYRRLGFTTAPIGHHQGRATSNYCIMFPDTYLELLGILRPELDSGPLAQELATRGEGLQRLALSTPDADAARADLEAAGLHPDGPHDLARPSEDPKGIVRFRNLQIPPADTANVRMFLCGHKTPELMRRPDWMAHANGARAFAGITVVVEDMEPVAVALGKVFGAAAVATVDHGVQVNTGRGTISVSTPANFGNMHPGVAPPDLPLPSYYGLRVAVSSLDATAAYLKGEGIPAERVGGAVRVAPELARGVLLEFVPG